LIVNDVPVVSIIVPAFNAYPAIEQALVSCEDQTLGDFEVVVVDDGSDQGLAPLLNQYSFTLEVHRQSNQGASAARNAGARLSRGDYLVFLDADDVLRPRCVEVIAEGAASGAATIYGGIEVIDVATSIRESHLPHRLGPAFNDVEGIFLPGAYAVRKDLFLRIGGFSSGLRYGEHSELGLRLVEELRDEANPAWSSNEVVVTKYHDRGPQRYAHYDQARKEGAEYVVQVHRERLARDPNLLADYYAIAGVSSFRLGSFKRGRSHLWNAAMVAPTHPEHLARAVISLLPSIGRLYWRRDDRRERQ
jgi:glycosyltransferase involved in cell wall biosynthesis